MNDRHHAEGRPDAGTYLEASIGVQESRTRDAHVVMAMVMFGGKGGGGGKRGTPMVLQRL